ncbi:hydantoinase/oxoprolinase family protein [Sphaerotilus natans]|uniref:hydantoinase/oxoprolinase family protein n=1 Tax=Sphaerotilus natans TaxID=34103 RepID=UPI00406C3C05
MWRSDLPVPGMQAGAEAGVVIGWDVGGAHLKAARWQDGHIDAVLQFACPLWQGLGHLDTAVDAVCARWPEAAQPRSRHAVTMSGEMTDLFADREDGVRRIGARLRERLPGELRLYAGPGHWLAVEAGGDAWPQVASANWRATASHCAARRRAGLLVDIGSTTTDLIAFAGGRVLGRSLSDRDRLASGELVYHGVVRTPLCALARRIALQGQELNVMNEFFATSADVYRLTGELDPAHDLHPPADGAGKSLRETQARLARMVGCDVRDAGEADWLAFARAWRARQVDLIASQAARVLAAHRAAFGAAPPVLVAAGCGAFLLPELQARLGWPGERLDYGRDIAGIGDAAVATMARVCAPSVAVAALRAGDADADADEGHDNAMRHHGAQETLRCG